MILKCLNKAYITKYMSYNISIAEIDIKNLEMLDYSRVDLPEGLKVFSVNITANFV